MLTLHQVEEQLERIGCNFRFWGRAEIRELPMVMMPGEVIAGAVNGRYSGGGALLVATNYRLLLIDRKPLFLTIEDMRFDMIAEIDFNAQLFNSTIFVNTPTRRFSFSSSSQKRLRNILNHIQQRVMDVRQYYLQQQFGVGYARHPRVTPGHVGVLALQGDDVPLLTEVGGQPQPRTPLITQRRF